MRRKTREQALRIIHKCALAYKDNLAHIKPIQRIATIFQKKRLEEKYNILTYIAKGLTIDDNNLVTVLREKVDVQMLTATFPIPRKS